MFFKSCFNKLLIIAALLLGAAAPAHAVDGCKVLLCFAGNWRDISECRPEVEQALKDQAKGKGWPTCSMANGNGTQQGANTIDTKVIYGKSCPYYFRQWTFVPDPSYNNMENGTSWDGKIYGRWKMTCACDQILATTIDGKPWKASYLMPTGETVDEWLPAALEAMPDVANDAGDSTNLEAVKANWIAAGSPTTKPPLPGPNYVDLGDGIYWATYPFGDTSGLGNWFEDGVYQPW